MSVRPEESEKDVRNTEQAPANGDALVTAGRAELTNPALKKAPDLRADAQTSGALVIDDPYRFHQGDDKVQPDAKKTEGNGQTTKFDSEIQKKLDANIAAFKQELTDSNFKVGFSRNEGPEQALLKMQHAAQEKAHSGKELTSQEKAVAGMSYDEIHKEAIRIRDRDFKEMKTEDGKPRHWYTTKDTPSRYSSEEIDKMVQAKEKELTKQAEEAQHKLDAAKPKPEEKPLPAQAEIKPEIKAEVKPEDQAAEAARKAAVEAAIDKNVPTLELMEKAKNASGLDIDMGQFRDAIKAVVQSDLAAGNLQPSDLQKNMPRVGAILIASGAVTQDEFNAALKEQAQLKQANNGPVPRVGDILRGHLSADRTGKFDAASKFYDELKKLEDAAAQK